jgi:hypothetical protein
VKWVSVFLVAVATPLVVLAAAAVVPVGWLAVAGLAFVVAGLAALVAMRQRQLLE